MSLLYCFSADASEAVLKSISEKNLNIKNGYHLSELNTQSLQNVVKVQSKPVKIYSCTVFDRSRFKGLHLGEGYSKTAAKTKALQKCQIKTHFSKCPDSIDDVYFTCESSIGYLN